MGGSAPPAVQLAAKGGAASGESGSAFAVPAGGGSFALAGPAREYVENFFGRSFGHVRIHTGVEAERAAEAIGAYAFTVGKDVYFGRGQFRPETPQGMALLVHELTHVIQQGDGIARKAVAGVAADAVALEKIWRYEASMQPKRRLAGGRPLFEHERREIEDALADGEAEGGGAAAPVQAKPDLSRVRVHTGAAAAEAVAGAGAEAYASGESIVLSRKAASDVAAGEIGVLAHEAVHVGQQQRGLAQRAARDPFRQWMLEQEALGAEQRFPVQARLWDRIRSGAQQLIEDESFRREIASHPLGGLRSVASRVLRLPGGGEGAPEEPAPSKEGAAQGASEEESERRDGANLIEQLMRFFGVRPHIGEEEFLDELTERVMDLMEEELLIDSERRSTVAPFGAPF